MLVNDVEIRMNNDQFWNDFTKIQSTNTTSAKPASSSTGMPYIDFELNGKQQSKIFSLKLLTWKSYKQSIIDIFFNRRATRNESQTIDEAVNSKATNWFG